jgi:hypothetical protein
LSLSRQGVSSGRAQQVNVEHRVDFYRHRQLQLVGVQANNPINAVGAQKLLVQLLLEAGSLNVTGVQPYQVVLKEPLGRLAFPVSVLLILGQCYTDFRA